jgi:hypothetical protein
MNEHVAKLRHRAFAVPAMTSRWVIQSPTVRSGCGSTKYSCRAALRATSGWTRACLQRDGVSGSHWDVYLKGPGEFQFDKLQRKEAVG